MPTTRKKVIKTVYKDENSDEEEGGDFSDSGSDAVISEASSSEDDVDSEPSSNEEFGDSFYKLKLKHPPKKSTKPLIRKRMKRKSSNSLMKDNLNASIFSVKDLTETDKLLPSTLNLSESDSSDEESPKTLDTSSSTKFQLPEQDNESVDEVNIEYKNVWSNINGVQDDSEAIAKKTFMELEQHKSQMEETKTTLQNYTLKLNKRESNVRDLLALGEETISTPEVSTVSKKSKLQKGKNDSDSDAEDWEEVNENKAIPQQSIQLLVEFPEAGRKKTKKIDIEMMMKRKINRVKKEYQIYMHKVHVLCWLGHGNFISRVLNDRILMAAALSLVPSKERRPQNKVGIKYIEEIITWYNSYITLKLDRNEDKFKSQSPPLKAVLLELIKKKVVTSKKYLVYLFVVLLRALGLQCRVIFNFVTLPIKPPATALCSLSTKSKDEEANSPQMEKLTMKKIKSEAIKTTTECRITKLPHKTKPKIKNIAQIDGNYDYYSDDELKKFDRSNESVFYNDYENIMQVDGADDNSTTRRIRRIKRPIADVATNIEFENRSPKRSRKDSTPISLELHTKGDEGKYSKVNKRAKGENNTVDKKEICEEKDHSNNVNNHFKELTNINSGKVREANATPNLPRKSPRHTVQRTHNKPSENKNLHENKRTQKNRRILHASDNSAAKKIKQENISKTKSRSTPEPHTRYDDNDDVERPPRGEKLVNGKTIHGFEDKYKTCSNKLIETPVIPSESFKKDVSPPKQLRKSKRCLVLKSPAQGDGIQDTCAYKKSDRCLDSKENCDTNNHYKFSNNNSTVTTKKLTRGRINEVKKDINNTNSNIINRKALSTEQKNKSIVTKDKDNLNINEEITTRKIIKYNTRKKGNNPKSITTHIRLTRKQSQTMNTSDATEEQEKNRTRIFQGISTESCDKTQHIPKISVTEELSKIKQVGIRKNPTRNKKLGSVMDVEESENNMVAKSKLAAKKRISKGKIKEEFDNDLDYLPIEEKPRHSDSEDDFKPTTSKPKAKTNRRRLLSLPTEDGAIKKNNTDVWCEIFDEELRQWICVDIMRGKVISTKEVYMNATHPVCYVVGWDNNNYLKDLTRKYVPHYNTETRKLRVDPLWWRKAILPYIGPQTLRDKEEDEYLDKMQLDAPLPTVIGEYKNHPLYVLKRHLLKFEALYPPEPTVLGFVRGEPVYARECVFTCRARHVWYKDHAKVVKLGEKPYKLVRARPRWDKINRKVINDDPPLEIFGPWQVEDFVPPMAENGIVPRNEYGNVELFKQCMLPRGTVHLKLPGLNKTAKKLNIDCATAITGFELVNGWVRPVYDGFVVCEEFEDIITEAWADDQEEQERKVQEKTELRIYGNWKRMIKGLLIRERLKNKYGFEEPIASGVGNGKSKGQRVFANNKKK